MDASVVDDAEEDRWNLKKGPPPRTPKPGQPPPQHRNRSLNTPDEVMRVGATSPPQSVALSIQRSIVDEMHYPTIRAIGAGAVAQACKGIAIARGHMAVRGVDLACNIGFDNVLNENDEEISAQTFRLFLR